jgi:thiol:disulfide interchange protein DsbD
VLLPVKITPPEKIVGGSDVRVNALVNWLVCREICVPGRVDVALTLPVRTATSEPPSTTRSLFAKAQADLPRPAPKSWKVTAHLDEHWFVLSVVTGKREAAATFFPLEPNQIENTAPQKASPLAQGIRIEVQKSDQMLKAPLQLKGVLEFASGQGYTIEAPVIASK